VLSKVELLILQLVADHNGEWYWYHLDRALSYRQGLAGPYRTEIKALACAGLIDVRAHNGLGSVRYWITDAGRSQLLPPDDLEV
jgi:hypothetical protein